MSPYTFILSPQHRDWAAHGFWFTLLFAVGYVVWGLNRRPRPSKTRKPAEPRQGAEPREGSKPGPR